jgi:hypothetical protein
MSARTLRKLPFLTIALTLRACASTSTRAFLDALRVTVERTKADHARLQ